MGNEKLCKGPNIKEASDLSDSKGKRRKQTTSKEGHPVEVEWNSEVNRRC